MCIHQYVKYYQLLNILIILTTQYCGVGVSGQNVDYSVTIMPDPVKDTYLVGETLTLTCMIDPTVPTNATVIYTWECGGCFAEASMASTVTRTLTDMDNSTIDCSATVDGGNITMTDMTSSFDLQVMQGM